METLQFEALEGKKVIVHVIKEDGSLDELKGVLQAASENGVLIQFGKQMRLIKPDELEEIAEAPGEPKKLKPKILKPVNSDELRQHLADRHGVKLSKLESGDTAGMTEWHNKAHGDVLGHKHEIKGADKQPE